MPAPTLDTASGPDTLRLRSARKDLKGKDGEVGEIGPAIITFCPTGATQITKDNQPGHVRIQDVAEDARPQSIGSDIYLGSYPRSPYRPRLSLDVSPGFPTPRGSDVGSRASSRHLHLDQLLQHEDVQLDTYGVEELRDGFFDATFLPPPEEDDADLLDEAISTLPGSFHRHDPLSFYYFFPKQWDQFKSLSQRVFQTRSGVKLLKSFLGVLVSYLICLVPESRAWLGRYNYIIVVSAVLNHPGRSIGSQIDGCFFTIVGTVAGMAWGGLALYVSTSTPAARVGYGGIIAAFLIIFTATVSWYRCVYIRLYQAVIPAGIALCYTCLANTSDQVSWKKLLNYGIPWLLGQAIGLLVSLLVFPSAGSRPLASSIYGSLNAIERALEQPLSGRVDIFTRRNLAWHFVDLSQAYRDFAIEITYSRLRSEDVRTLRNAIQRVIKSSLSLKPGSSMFPSPADKVSEQEEISINITTPISPDEPDRREAVELIRSVLSQPTRNLLNSMSEALSCSNSAMMKIIGYTKLLNPTRTYQYTLLQSLERLRTARQAFDEADAYLIGHPKIPTHLHAHGPVVELFLIMHPVRQTANSVEGLILKIMDVEKKAGRTRVCWPSYPLSQMMLRTNPQVRHDRGGLTVGFFFQSKRQMEQMMRKLERSTFPPDEAKATAHYGMIKGKLEEEEIDAKVVDSKSGKLRYRLWKVLHGLQGFETRFAVKMAILTTLLSTPAWVPRSRHWWNRYDAWWAVVFVWIMMHPRVGGNFQDLVTRSIFLLLGALLGALAYACSLPSSSPYLLLPLFFVAMPPLLYRYTQSSHPRSGILAVLSFVIISLSCLTLAPDPDSSAGPSTDLTVAIALPRTLAILIGTTSAILVNWIFSPFVARHALRRSLSTSLIDAGILYRHILSTYIYPPPSQPLPSEETIKRSEIIESHLRESFVRHRDLLDLTRHEIRLRGPFDPLPWSGLIQALEGFFEKLVEVRQSSLYFGDHIRSQVEAQSTGLEEKRRDAIAAVLMDLYILAGALRSGRPIPRYLPSPAAARKRLLDRMEEVGQGVEIERSLLVEHSEALRPQKSVAEQWTKDRAGGRWADVYQYAYSTALTDIVEQVEGMRRFTKKICGEKGFESLPCIDRV